jgi:hypothetical protein
VVAASNSGAHICTCRVIFEDNTNPFIEARATATKVGVPGAIFRSALQKVDGLQSVFDLANGFLDLTSTVYVGFSWPRLESHLTTL